MATGTSRACQTMSWKGPGLKLRLKTIKDATRRRTLSVPTQASMPTQGLGFGGGLLAK